MHYILSIEVCKEDVKTLITWYKYTKDLIKKFNMNEYHLVSTPFEQNVNLYKDHDT